MTVIVHIGPPKTATTSLQKSVIPGLGIPFEIRPDWTRRLAREQDFSAARRTECDLIVSDEILGEFGVFGPEVIASRLARVFPAATVIFCTREPLSLFYSLYRQRIINSIGLYGRAVDRIGTAPLPDSPAMFLGGQWLQYSQNGSGFFAQIDSNRVRAAFQTHFEVKTLSFDLLKKGSLAFAPAFSGLCGVPPTAEMSWENETTPAKLESAFAALPVGMDAALLDIYREYFTATLTPDQEAFITASPEQRAKAFVTLKRRA